MRSKFIAATLLSIALLYPCLLFFDLFEPTSWDTGAVTAIALPIAAFSYWMTRG